MLKQRERIVNPDRVGGWSKGRDLGLRRLSRETETQVFQGEKVPGRDVHLHAQTRFLKVSPQQSTLQTIQ